MNAGRFDRLITFQTQTVTRDNIGGAKNAWETFTQMWAMYKPDGGTEDTNADRVEAKEMATFICRYRSDLTAKMRISFDSRYYNILSINEITRRGYLTIKTIAITI
jgi:SPP1 family predicted phage head-tail adaptor